MKARQRLDQALAAPQDPRAASDPGTAATQAQEPELWAQAKAEWQAALARQRSELRMAWREWQAARVAVLRLVR